MKDEGHFGNSEFDDTQHQRRFWVEPPAEETETAEFDAQALARALSVLESQEPVAAISSDTHSFEENFFGSTLAQSIVQPFDPDATRPFVPLSLLQLAELEHSRNPFEDDDESEIDESVVRNRVLDELSARLEWEDKPVFLQFKEICPEMAELFARMMFRKHQTAFFLKGHGRVAITYEEVWTSLQSAWDNYTQNPSIVSAKPLSEWLTDIVTREFDDLKPYSRQDAEAAGYLVEEAIGAFSAHPNAEFRNHFRRLTQDVSEDLEVSECSTLDDFFYSFKMVVQTLAEEHHRQAISFSFKEELYSNFQAMNYIGLKEYAQQHHRRLQLWRLKYSLVSKFDAARAYASYQEAADRIERDLWDLGLNNEILIAIFAKVLLNV